MSPSIELEPRSERSHCLACKTRPIGPGKTKYCSEKCQQKAQQQARKDRIVKSRTANLETGDISVKMPCIAMPIADAALPHCVVCDSMASSAGVISYCSKTCRNKARKARKAARPSPRNDALGAKKSRLVSSGRLLTWHQTLKLMALPIPMTAL